MRKSDLQLVTQCIQGHTALEHPEYSPVHYLRYKRDT